MIHEKKSDNEKLLKHYRNTISGFDYPKPGMKIPVLHGFENVGAGRVQIFEAFVLTTVPGGCGSTILIVKTQVGLFKVKWSRLEVFGNAVKALDWEVGNTVEAMHGNCVPNSKEEFSKLGYVGTCKGVDICAAVSKHYVEKVAKRLERYIDENY